MNSEIAIKQLKEIEKRGRETRLAADGWKEDWKTLVATLMSARTKDKLIIPVAEKLFSKYKTINELAKAKVSDVEKIIRSVNFYRTKSKNVVELAKMVVKEYSSKIPIDFDKLVELPGVGRKTANVFLAEKGESTIGVDTHLTYISNYLGWTKHHEQKKIEEDLKKLFPEKLWGDINWKLVRFGQTYTNFKEKNKILNEIKKIK